LVVVVANIITITGTMIFVVVVIIIIFVGATVNRGKQVKIEIKK